MLLSVCILLKGEAIQLERIYSFVNGLADEIVVVCDFPVSKTLKEAAIRCQARLIPYVWQNDFAAARNSGIDAARGEWIFWIDSDETLIAPDAAQFQNLLKCDDVLGYRVTIEDITSRSLVSPRQHTSLYRRRSEIRYVGRIHEHFNPSLESLASKWKMKVVSSPIRLRHTGYLPALQKEKLVRNISILKMELQERPGQLYYLIELGRSLLLSGQSQGHAVLAKAAKLVKPFLSNPESPLPLVAALLEYALTFAPPGFVISKAAAAEIAERWFPSSPPLKWWLARWHFQSGRISKAAEVLEGLVAMSMSNFYDNTTSFDHTIFGDEARLNLGVCYSKLGQTDRAIEQFIKVKSDGQFFEMAISNLNQLKKQRQIRNVKN